MLPRVLMWAGLLTVAGAAAMLSFAALRDLALMCGFGRRLAWLLPVAIDVGTALGSLVWLGRWTPDPARRYARGLALALLGGSVAGNALGHGLVAYSARPHWLVVVAVSAVAPAVLGAVVHLAVLATHTSAVVVADPPDHEPDHAGPVVDQADHRPDQTGPAAGPPDHPDRDAPGAEDLLAALDVPAGWVPGGPARWTTSRTGTRTRPDHRTTGPPDRTAGAGSVRPRRDVGR